MTDPRVPPTSGADAVLKFRLLHPYRRLEALRIACDDALAIWRRYCAAEKPIEYVDSIVGIRHTVDETLPARALADVDRRLAGAPIASTVETDYVEPIVAMQDEDLDFPPDIENVYYAIYNLHRLCLTAKTLADEEVVIAQVGNAAEVSIDDWSRDWWTRCWDAWATRPDPIYEPVVDVFDALAAGDLTAALGTAPSGLVHAILLALTGPIDLALAAVATATGADIRDPALARWLSEHVYDLVPEVIAVSPDRSSYAATRGKQIAIRDARTGAVLGDSVLQRHHVRFARYTSNQHLYVAGDLLDDIGTLGSFYSLYQDHRSTALGWGERPGRVAVAAVGPGVWIAQRAEAVLAGKDLYELLGRKRVVAASISIDGRFVATHDGQEVAIWDREGDRSRVLERAGRPQRLTIAGGKLLVIWADRTVSLHGL